MRVYYNEFDSFAVAWLRELIADGLLPPGDVDQRDIRDVRAGDLAGYDQCHFFAGIGGWPYALQLAGWEGPVWTGSCPCQPFSIAGRGGGFADPRHLWPTWFRLIRECRPPVLFGEQVASADGLAWFDTVSTELEAETYAVGAADLCAAGVGAPHRRQRLWFVADREAIGRGAWRDSGSLPLSEERTERSALESLGRGEDAVRLVVADQPGPQGRPGQAPSEGAPAPLSGPWDELLWLPCRDGKARPTQPGLQPVAHGIPNRVGTLRGAGNGICPQVAAEMIGAYMDLMR